MDRESGESLEKVTDAPKLVATDACHEALKLSSVNQLTQRPGRQDAGARNKLSAAATAATLRQRAGDTGADTE